MAILFPQRKSSPYCAWPAKTYWLGPQSVVPGAAAATVWPESLLELQSLWAHPSPTKSESYILTRFPKWCKCTLICEKHQPTGSASPVQATPQDLSSPPATRLAQSASLQVFLLVPQRTRLSPVQSLCTECSLYYNKMCFLQLSVSLISLPHLPQIFTHENFPSHPIYNWKIFSRHSLFPAFFPPRFFAFYL